MSTMVEEKTFVLSAKDRCDRCNSEALVWVNLLSGDLLFCGHHYGRHEEMIAASAIEIVDERSKLYV